MLKQNSVTIPQQNSLPLFNLPPLRICITPSYAAQFPFQIPYEFSSQCFRSLFVYISHFTNDNTSSTAFSVSSNPNQHTTIPDQSQIEEIDDINTFLNATTRKMINLPSDFLQDLSGILLDGFTDPRYNQQAARQQRMDAQLQSENQHSNKFSLRSKIQSLRRQNRSNLTAQQQERSSTGQNQREIASSRRKQNNKKPTLKRKILYVPSHRAQSEYLLPRPHQYFINSPTAILPSPFSPAFCYALRIILCVNCFYIQIHTITSSSIRYRCFLGLLFLMRHFSLYFHFFCSTLPPITTDTHSFASLPLHQSTTSSPLDQLSIHALLPTSQSSQNNNDNNNDNNSGNTQQDLGYNYGTHNIVTFWICHAFGQSYRINTCHSLNTTQNIQSYSSALLTCLNLHFLPSMNILETLCHQLDIMPIDGQQDQQQQQQQQHVLNNDLQHNILTSEQFLSFSSLSLWRQTITLHLQSILTFWLFRLVSFLPFAFQTSLDLTTMQNSATFRLQQFFTRHFLLAQLTRTEQLITPNQSLNQLVVADYEIDAAMYHHHLENITTFLTPAISSSSIPTTMINNHSDNNTNNTNQVQTPQSSFTNILYVPDYVPFPLQFPHLRQIYLHNFATCPLSQTLVQNNAAATSWYTTLYGPMSTSQITYSNSENTSQEAHLQHHRSYCSECDSHHDLTNHTYPAPVSHQTDINAQSEDLLSSSARLFRLFDSNSSSSSWTEQFKQLSHRWIILSMYCIGIRHEIYLAIIAQQHTKYLSPSQHPQLSRSVQWAMIKDNIIKVPSTIPNNLSFSDTIAQLSIKQQNVDWRPYNQPYQSMNSHHIAPVIDLYNYQARMLLNPAQNTIVSTLETILDHHVTFFDKMINIIGFSPFGWLEYIYTHLDDELSFQSLQNKETTDQQPLAQQQQQPQQQQQFTQGDQMNHHVQDISFLFQPLSADDNDDDDGDDDDDDFGDDISFHDNISDNNVDTVNDNNIIELQFESDSELSNTEENTNVGANFNTLSKFILSEENDTFLGQHTIIFPSHSLLSTQPVTSSQTDQDQHQNGIPSSQKRRQLNKTLNQQPISNHDDSSADQLQSCNQHTTSSSPLTSSSATATVAHSSDAMTKIHSFLTNHKSCTDYLNTNLTHLSSSFLQACWTLALPNMNVHSPPRWNNKIPEINTTINDMTANTTNPQFGWSELHLATFQHLITQFRLSLSSLLHWSATSTQFQSRNNNTTELPHVHACCSLSSVFILLSHVMSLPWLLSLSHYDVHHLAQPLQLQFTNTSTKQRRSSVKQKNALNGGDIGGGSKGSQNNHHDDSTHISNDMNEVINNSSVVKTKGSSVDNDVADPVIATKRIRPFLVSADILDDKFGDAFFKNRLQTLNRQAREHDEKTSHVGNSDVSLPETTLVQLSDSVPQQRSIQHIPTLTPHSQFIFHNLFIIDLFPFVHRTKLFYQVLGHSLRTSLRASDLSSSSSSSSSSLSSPPSLSTLHSFASSQRTFIAGLSAANAVADPLFTRPKTSNRRTSSSTIPTEQQSQKLSLDVFLPLETTLNLSIPAANQVNIEQLPPSNNPNDTKPSYLHLFPSSFHHWYSPSVICVDSYLATCSINTNHHTNIVSNVSPFHITTTPLIAMPLPLPPPFVAAVEMSSLFPTFCLAMIDSFLPLIALQYFPHISHHSVLCIPRCHSATWGTFATGCHMMYYLRRVEQIRCWFCASTLFTTMISTNNINNQLITHSTPINSHLQNVVHSKQLENIKLVHKIVHISHSQLIEQMKQGIKYIIDSFSDIKHRFEMTQNLSITPLDECLDKIETLIMALLHFFTTQTIIPIQSQLETIYNNNNDIDMIWFENEIVKEIASELLQSANDIFKQFQHDGNHQHWHIWISDLHNIFATCENYFRLADPHYSSIISFQATSTHHSLKLLQLDVLGFITLLQNQLQNVTTTATTATRQQIHRKEQQIEFIKQTYVSITQLKLSIMNQLINHILPRFERIEQITDRLHALGEMYIASLLQLDLSTISTIESSTNMAKSYQPPAINMASIPSFGISSANIADVLETTIAPNQTHTNDNVSNTTEPNDLNNNWIQQNIFNIAIQRAPSTFDQPNPALLRHHHITEEEENIQQETKHQDHTATGSISYLPSSIQSQPLRGNQSAQPAPNVPWTEEQ